MRNKRSAVSRVLVCTFLWLVAAAVAGQSQPLLDPTTQAKFVNPVPVPAAVDLTKGGKFDVFIRETNQWLGLRAPDNTPLLTRVWGLQLAASKYIGGSAKAPKVPTYPGPTFVAMSNVPVDITWKNELPPYNNAFPGPGGHLLPVDPNIHMDNTNGGIPTVIHVHGGHTESASDGLPHQWFTQFFAQVGPDFVQKKFHYDNSQEGAALLYHDHAIGVTRLNVYAGILGFYLLRDTNTNQLIANGVLPAGAYEAGLAVQDKMFTATGQLFWPSTNPDIEEGYLPLPPGPSMLPEMFGDFIVVNGMTWPFLNVEPRKYRFYLTNVSDSRFFAFEFRDAEIGGTAQTFLQVGTDDALLPTPVALTRLVLGPGERADIVVNFAGQSALYLRNFGPDEPFKGLNPDGTNSDGEGGVLPPADPATTGKVMKFRVNLPFNPNVPNATVALGTNLRPAITALTPTGGTRGLGLFEGLDEFGRIQPLLGTVEDGSLVLTDPITENPMVNDVEMWEIYNATADAHPIHLHLVSFQIVNRESFTGTLDEKPQIQHNGEIGLGYKLTDIVLGGDARLPEPNERGWKDTAVMLPGEVTRVVARFDRPGKYVWHCHILSHEEHDMMREFFVGPMPAFAGPAPAGPSEPGVATTGVALSQNVPNPFNPTTSIGFDLVQPGMVDLRVYNVAGQEVRTLATKFFPAGSHSMEWDGRDALGNQLPSGVYFYQLRSGNFVEKRKMVMLK